MSASSTETGRLERQEWFGLQLLDQRVGVFCRPGCDRVEIGNLGSKKPRISKQGNWRVRRALYFAAMVASRHNPTVRTYYQRLLNRGEEKKAALVACMRKLLQISRGVLKNQTPFREMPNSA